MFSTIRPVAQKVWNAVMMDSANMLSPACYDDFGITGSQEEMTRKFGALQAAARNGATAAEFDEALGSGRKLTAMVRKYGINDVQFSTLWDMMEPASSDEE